MGNDFTVTRRQSYDSDDANTIEYSRSFFDGTNKLIYSQNQENQNKLSGGDLLFKQDNQGKISLIYSWDEAGFWGRQNNTNSNLGYDDVIPLWDKLSLAFFTKQNDLTYVAKSDAGVKDLVASSLMPSIYSFSGGATAVSIQLTADKSKVDYVNIVFTDSIGLPERIRITYSDVGTTELPSYASEKIPQ